MLVLWSKSGDAISSILSPIKGRKMSKEGRKCFNLIFLTLLLLISASISLLHTDTAGEEDPYCPVCVFQSTSMATAVIYSFQLPDLVMQGTVRSEAGVEYSTHVAIILHARSPPAA
jgi:hypothetical protein